MRPHLEWDPLPETPLVSVILTSYNYAQFVGEAIQSVLAQTYHPIELIIVDDGSTDNSREIIAACIEDAPIPVQTLFKANEGQASAWNAAFGHVRGEVVCTLDSDDTWRPTKIECMLRFMQEAPGGAVYQHQLEDTHGNLNRPTLRSGDLYAEWERLASVNAAIRRDLIANFVPSSGLLWRKQVLDRVFPIPLELTTCPDAYATRCACAYGPVYSHPAVLGCWRNHGANAGMQRDYSFRRFWVPVIMPALNQYFAARELPVRFSYNPLAVAWLPLTEICAALRRRYRQAH